MRVPDERDAVFFLDVVFDFALVFDADFDFAFDALLERGEVVFRAVVFFRDVAFVFVRDFALDFAFVFDFARDFVPADFFFREADVLRAPVDLRVAEDLRVEDARLRGRDGRPEA